MLKRFGGAMAVVPVPETHHGSNTCAVLQLVGDSFSDGDVPLTVFGRMAGSAVAYISEAIAQQAESALTGTLVDVAMTLTSNLSLRRSTTTSRRSRATWCRARGARSTSPMTPRSSSTLCCRRPLGAALKKGEGAPGLAAQTLAPVALRSPASDPRFSGDVR